MSEAPEIQARRLLEAGREKKKAHGLSGWGEDTIPVEVIVIEETHRQKHGNESIAMMAWRLDYIAEVIKPRDVLLHLDVKRPQEPTRAKEQTNG